jgi:predicted nucleic acid-binding protein
VFVVDASVTLAWCFSDEASATADAALDRLEREEAVVPVVWPLEVANGLRTAERRGRMHLADLPRIRELLLSLPVQVEAVDLGMALGEVTEIARSLGLTAYDAAYLGLAARLRLPLATVDDRLRRAATVAGVALVGLGGPS